MGGLTRLTVLVGDHERLGEVRLGESWLGAARRLCHEAGAQVPSEPVPLDLSGPVKRFVVDPDLRVALRPMTRGDLPDVSRWRSAAHVRRWFDADGEPDLPGVTALYGPRIDGDSATTMWVVEVNGRSVGFLQDYRLADYPEYAVPAPDPGAVGVDYAIGEPGFVGRGIGTRMLWAWALAARRRWPDVPAYFSAPDHRNAASLRALEKAGFVPGVWFDEPAGDGRVDTVVGCVLEVTSVLG